VDKNGVSHMLFSAYERCNHIAIIAIIAIIDMPENTHHKPTLKTKRLDSIGL
jgi:hypothetical protein